MAAVAPIPAVPVDSPDVTMQNPVPPIPGQEPQPPQPQETASETLYIQNLNEKIKIDGAFQYLLTLPYILCIVAAQL